MIDHHYVWFTWSMLLLVLWALLFLCSPRTRARMWKMSLLTMPFGLSEPLFVPRYWNPPSLFDLAQKTRFDIESFIFCFAIAGICTVLYDLVIRRAEVQMSESVRRSPMHRLHVLALVSPVIVFFALVWFPWNPIYPGIIAMLAGAVAAILCRQDLKTRTWVGGVLFLLLYSVLLQGLRASSPGYVEHVWNFRNLTGIEILGMPLEELLFAASFGMFWSGVYEHIAWRADEATVRFHTRQDIVATIYGNADVPKDDY
jgi:hypothetical protein